MDVTLSGISIFVRDTQVKNAELPMEVTLLGITIFVKEVQL